MEQRLTTLDKVSVPHYAESSPLILEAYALHLDNVSKQCVAQLKLRNIGKKTINAVVVELCCFDTFNHKLASISHHYTRLSAEKNCIFGDKNAIALPNDKVSKFSVFLKAVSYADGSAWEPNEPKEFYLLSAPIPPSLEGELLEQYQRDLVRQGIHTTIRNQAQKAANLWQCVCGSWQPENEACLACGSRQKDLLEAANVSMLELHLKEYHAEQERLKEEVRLVNEQKEKERRQQQEEKESRRVAARAKRKKIIISLVLLLMVAAALFLLSTEVVIPNQKYDAAMALMNDGKYIEAISAFEALEGYKDSATQISVCETIIRPEKYDAAVVLMEKGDYVSAAIAFGELTDYQDAKERSFALWQHLAQRDTFAASYHHTVTLQEDGTVVAEGQAFDGECDVCDWRDIVAVSAGYYHTVGLKEDSTVVAVGDNDSGQCDVSDWRDIVAVSAGYYHTVGLKNDGTVVAVGFNSNGRCDVTGWRNIIAISTKNDHTVGLKKDGTVVATGDSDSGKCDVSGWRDIVAVSAGDYHTVGLKKDGTVVAVGDSDSGQCDVCDWRDIVAISAGNSHTVGLKKDGTVVAAGKNYAGECNVNGWRDIVAVIAGDARTFGLKKDGTVVTIGGWN